MFSCLLIKRDNKKYLCNQLKKRVSIATILVISTVIGVYSLSFNGLFSWSDNEYYNYAFTYNLEVVDSKAMTVLFSFVKVFSNNFDLVLFLLSFFGCFCMLLSYRYARYGNYFAVVFIFSTTFFIQFCQTALKQIIAISFLNISFILFEKKKYFFSLLLIPIACLFHFSSIISIPILILFSIGQIKDDANKLAILSFLFLITLPFIINISLLAKLFSFVPSIASKINEYQEYGFAIGSTSAIAVKYFPFYLLSIGGWLYRNKFKFLIKNYDSYLLITVFGSFILLFSIFSYWMSRMLPYFLLFVGEMLSIISSSKNGDSTNTLEPNDSNFNFRARPLRTPFVLILIFISFVFTFRELFLYYPLF